MHLAYVGIIADILWPEIPHHTHHVELGTFVDKPNHVHGVLIIQDHGDGANDNNDINNNDDTNQAIGQQRFQNIRKNSISSIVGSYK